MPLGGEKAILELDLSTDSNTKTGAFVMRGDLSDSAEIVHNYLAAKRGQYLSEVYRQVSEYSESIEGPGEGGRRQGYHLDGGAGSITHTLSFSRGVNEQTQWGDGSTDPTDPTDYSKYDATGAGVWPQRDVFEYWTSQARTDSGGQARLYLSEWSDGTYADSPGVFGAPMPVAIQSVTLEKPEDDPSAFSGTLEVVRTETVGNIGELADDVVDTLGDALADWG